MGVRSESVSEIESECEREESGSESGLRMKTDSDNNVNNDGEQ